MGSVKEQLKKIMPPVDTHYRIGMRVIKTAASVFICLIIALLIGSDDYLQISAVSALVTLRATQDETLHSGIFRVVGTVIGGLFGVLTILIGLFLPYYSQGLFVLVIPIILVIDLYTCNLFKMPDSCSISCVVIIIVASHTQFNDGVAEAMIFTLLRVRDTLIGVVVATVINALPLLYQKRNGEAR